MAGEGLGKNPNINQVYQNHENYDVVSVGDFVLDKTIQLEKIPDTIKGSWKDEDWFPKEGESLTTEVPEEIEQYVAKEYSGGKASNQALAASHAGAKTAFLGETAWEQEKLEYMQEGGVNINQVKYSEGNANEAYVFIDEQGENRIAAQINNGTSQKYVQNNQETIMNAEYLLLSNGMPTQTLEEITKILEKGNETPEVILDPSPTNGLQKIINSSEIDYTTPNQIEHQQLYGDGKENHQILQTSAKGVKIDGKLIPSPKVDQVVDTTAAGDTFNGYLAAELSKDKTLEEAARKAGIAASKSVQKQGAQPSIPRKI